MKIVLTGATGMIGLAIARMGIEKKHEIICLINPGSSRKEHIEKMENVRIIECSVNEYDSLEIFSYILPGRRPSVQVVMMQRFNLEISGIPFPLQSWLKEWDAGCSSVQVHRQSMDQVKWILQHH